MTYCHNDIKKIDFTADQRMKITCSEINTYPLSTESRNIISIRIRLVLLETIHRLESLLITIVYFVMIIRDSLTFLSHEGNDRVSTD